MLSSFTPPPDLILLDVLMPGMDDFEVCRQLKADETTRAIPVIFITALATAEDKMKGFEAGAQDYVTKPLNYQEVLARVHTHVTWITLDFLDSRSQHGRKGDMLS